MYWLTVILILPYIFILLRLVRSLLKIESFNHTANPSTKVSVVVACHNEEDNLPGLLNSLLLQHYPQELFEVVIVNDNSSDKTYEIAAGFKGISNLIIINNEDRGKKKAIRTGIRASSNSLIITTDGDCRMGKEWIGTIASFYEENRPDMIICQVQIESRAGFFNRFQELEFLSLQGITAGTILTGDGIMCNGANMAFSRDTYHNHSDNLHFETPTGDDVFLLHSLKNDPGSKILWLESPESKVTTAPSPTAESYLRQRARWLSKWVKYKDRFTIELGAVTFITILLQLSVMVAAFIDPSYILIFTAVILLKSLPDFLILMNTSGRYGRRDLMKWFLPAQIVYPFYVIVVSVYSLYYRYQRR